MKVTSTKSISFPKLNWGISAGETKDLPENKEAQDRILQETEITKVESKINNQSQPKDTKEIK